jgi:Uma2 family endonuclease
MIGVSESITLEDFLELPETKPVGEYINGKAFEKPMPKSRHSLLQSELCMAINAVSKPLKIAYAFPELRCTFNGRSLVPDLAVLRWENIGFDEEGVPLDDVSVAPDWSICILQRYANEILSPDQSSNRVTANIAHCVNGGCELGWLIDPNDRSILVFVPNRLPELYQGDDFLVVLDDIDLR